MGKGRGSSGIDNTGAGDFSGNYLLDPDSSADLGRIPGIAGTDPGFRTSGWTQDFVYGGANAPNATAGGDPTGNIARWVDELDLYDAGLPDASRAVGTVTS